MLIVPDVHGRLFWKNAVSNKAPDEKVIFLGDYLDPYESLDFITPEEALVNFYDIIEYAKENTDTTILLLGNHDLGYINPAICKSRRDYKHYHEIQKIFLDNEDLFKIAYSEKFGRRNYLFTHAGVHKRWYDMLIDVFPNEDNLDIADYLNMLYKDYKNKFMNYLNIIPYRRYGDYEFGSCVWADVTEWFDKYIKFIPRYYQVFGHSLCREPIIEKKFAMLDARRTFKITSKEITEIYV